MGKKFTSSYLPASVSALGNNLLSLSGVLSAAFGRRADKPQLTGDLYIVFKNVSFFLGSNFIICLLILILFVDRNVKTYH